MGLSSIAEFTITLVISVISLAVAIWAVKISLKGNGLLMTLTRSVQMIDTRNRVKRGGTKTSETTKHKEIQLKEQAEQRKVLELEPKKNSNKNGKKEGCCQLNQVVY